MNEMDKVDVWIDQILAVKANPIIGIEFTYRSIWSVITATTLVIFCPPEVYFLR
jgi:hypothetical protein